MKFFPACVLAFVLGLSAARAELVYEVNDLPSPAGHGSLGASMAKAPDGNLWFSWVQEAKSGTPALRFSTFDRVAKKWTEARDIYRGKDLVATSAEFPALAVGANGRAAIVWTDGHGRGFFSQSTDNGKTWSAAAPLTRESQAVEKVSATALPDGRVMAAWLDGRAAKPGASHTQLFARVLGDAGADQLIDARVCDCCQTSLTSFPDGTVLLAYRGRSEEEFRDILVASFIEGKWDPRHANTHERWQINGCPVNGPSISSSGPRTSKAWYTAAYDEPRVLVATSPDAGGIYTHPMRADLGHPLGRVDTLLLRDGTQLVTWVENTTDKDGHTVAALYLRRYGPAANTHQPTKLAMLGDGKACGFPRIALVKDFDDTPAQFVATFNRPDGSSGIATLLVTMPDEELLVEADSSCACGAHGEELRGVPIRGHILTASSEKSEIRVRHGAVPGLFRAGERDFKAGPTVVAAVKADRDILARIEQRDGEWWIFDIRLLGTAQP